MTERFTGNSEECGTGSQGLCSCGNARRLGQWDCAECHALANRVYRVRRATRMRQATSEGYGEIRKRLEERAHDQAR